MKHLLVAFMLVLAISACGKDDQPQTGVVKPNTETGEKQNPEDPNVINEDAKITWAEVEKDCNKNIKENFGYDDAAIAKYCSCAVNTVAKKAYSLETFIKSSASSLVELFEAGSLDQCDKKPVFSADVYTVIY